MRVDMFVKFYLQTHLDKKQQFIQFMKDMITNPNSQSA